MSLIANTDPEGPSWPTLLVIALFLIVMFGSLALFAPHSQRHKHAQHCVVIVKDRAAQHCVVVKDRQ